MTTGESERVLRKWFFRSIIYNNRSSYKIVHDLLLLMFCLTIRISVSPLSGWLFPSPAARVFWGAVACVFAFPSPMMAFTADTYKQQNTRDFRAPSIDTQNLNATIDRTRQIFALYSGKCFSGCLFVSLSRPTRSNTDTNVTIDCINCVFSRA